MEKRDRFLLEQKIMDCWHVTDDIDVIVEYVGDSPGIDAKVRDRLLNMLVGLRDINNLKFDYTIQLLNELIQKGDIR